MQKKYWLLWGIIALVFFNACKGEPKQTGDAAAVKAEEIDYDIHQALNELVVIWNDAHNIQDSILFRSLYGDWVSYYGEDLRMETCIQNKMIFFRSHPDFKQELSEKINIEPLPAGNYRCSFTKIISYDGRSSTHEAYLIYLHFEDRFRIIKESDLKTDAFFREE